MKKLLITLAIFVLAFVASELAFGQATTAPPAAKRQWYHIQENTLKNGMLSEYSEFRAKERIPALKKAGYKHQEIWVPAAVGTGGTMYTIERWDDLSAFDQPQTRLTKALGEDGARALGKKTSQYFADGGSHAWLALSDPELSWTEQMTTPAKLAIVARVKVARGRRPDYRNYIKTDYLPIVKKSGVRGYQALSVVYGGDVDEYITLTFFDSFAEMEKNDPSLTSVQNRVAGEGTAQKNVQKTVGIIVNLERNILRFRPDLSILPK